MVRFALLSVVFAISALSALAQLKSGTYHIQDYKGRYLAMNEEGAPCTVGRLDPDSKKWAVTQVEGGYTFQSLKTETFAGYTAEPEHGDYVKNSGSAPGTFDVKSVVEGPLLDGLSHIYVPGKDLVMAPEETDPTNPIPNVRWEEPDDAEVPEANAVWSFVAIEE
ncbi:hypothetical protein FRC08_008985 [Ceratobasidium sp. 394]|nr:hypothetical protein FRC08_008985 [Ceratobasidium sp. 394]